MVDPVEEDTKHTKDQSMWVQRNTVSILKKEKGKVNQLDVGNKKKKKDQKKQDFRHKDMSWVDREQCRKV